MDLLLFVHYICSYPLYMGAVSSIHNLWDAPCHGEKEELNIGLYL